MSVEIHPERQLHGVLTRGRSPAFSEPLPPGLSSHRESLPFPGGFSVELGG